MIAWRDARRGDVGAIVALLTDDALGRAREGSDLGPYLAAFDEMAAQGGNVAVVGEDADGAVVACFQLAILPGLSLRAARRAQLEGVRVAAHLRGRGAGGALLEEAERRARAAGCALVQLTSHASRAEALRFYGAAGYAPSHVGFKKALF